jgi:hypothetical protein
MKALYNPYYFDEKGNPHKCDKKDCAGPAMECYKDGVRGYLCFTHHTEAGICTICSCKPADSPDPEMCQNCFKYCAPDIYYPGEWI